MPDELFANPRLAGLYDWLQGDRPDLAHYEAILAELGVTSVLDVGCGTGTLAVSLARSGFTVIGVDPAGASLDVAATKAGADAVRWVHGDATTLPNLTADAAIMTGNVGQVFTTDDSWQATLSGIAGAVRSGGHLVFEVRDPAQQAWLDWVRDKTERQHDIPNVGAVTTWIQVTDVSLPFVTFNSVYRFESDGAVLTSTSTLRFRSRAEVDASLAAAGFTVDEVRDAPDRPGKEWVFVTSRNQEQQRGH